MEERIYLRIDDLQKLTGTKYDNCRRIMQAMRDSLNKKKLPSGKWQEITIHEYCNYEGIPIEVVCKQINVQLKQ